MLKLKDLIIKNIIDNGEWWTVCNSENVISDIVNDIKRKVLNRLNKTLLQHLQIQKNIQFSIDNENRMGFLSKSVYLMNVFDPSLPPPVEFTKSQTVNARDPFKASFQSYNPLWKVSVQY